jgi:hypothetical protein
MLRSDADAPKPPAYPFIYQSVSKSADTKHAAHQNIWRNCHLASRSPAVIFATASDPFKRRFSHPSVSVKRLLRPRIRARKRKMTEP